MVSTPHAPTIAEAALILLAVVILAVSAVKVRLAWFGPSVSSRTNRIYFFVALISLISFFAVLLTLSYSSEEGRVERNALMICPLLAVNALGFAGGWRSAMPPATYDYAAARNAEPGSYLGSLFFLGLALAGLIFGIADILDIV